MEEELKKTSHISYKEYKNKIIEEKQSNNGITVFVSIFFLLLLLFLGIAKQISPDVDVSIGDEDSVTEEKSMIDERLKLIQMEDTDSMFASDLDEKVVIPEHKSEQVSEDEPVKPDTVKLESATPTPEQTASPVVSKVVVGYYETKEQAEVAKGIIEESGMNISPFVRSIGGAYTIQVGSFSTREKAQNAVNELLRNNYPARIISE